MQNPLEITFRNIDHDAEIESIIQEKFEKVTQISPDVTKCHIIIEKLSKHHQSANRSCIRLDLKAPHIKDIIVSEKCSENMAQLKKSVIKVFKRGKSLLREEVARRRDRNRHPTPDNLMPPHTEENEEEEENPLLGAG